MDAGVEVVPWTLPPQQRLTDAALLANKIFVADRCSWLKQVLNGEIPHQTVLGGVVLGSLPTWLNRALAWTLKQFTFTRRLGELLGSTFASCPSDTSSVWQMNSDVEMFQEEFVQYFKQANLDAVLCPTIGLPAVSHGRTTDLLPVVTYTTLYNVLQW